MKTPLFSGSSVALVTPFRGDEVDFEALERLIAWHRESGTAALTVCGTTGEASTLSDAERYAIVKFTKDRAGALPVIAGSGSNATARAVELSRLCAEAGADAVLAVTPYYNKATQRGLIAHYTALADAVPVPVILYNVPSRTGVSCAAETYRVLSAHPNIAGVKEASGDLALVAETLRLCGEDLPIWSGSDELTVPMMALGAKGVISVAANILPREWAKLTAEGQVKYARLLRLLFSEVNPIPVKAALARMGLCENTLRLPLTPMSGDKEEALAAELRRLNLI